VLTRLASGERVGTELVAETQTLGARKQWLADHVQLAGKVRLDDGAVRALAREGKSLLPIGVVAVEGASSAARSSAASRRRARGRARAGQLCVVRRRAHRAAAVVTDRGDPGLGGRAGAHPQG
jgi:glutamate 5-kinase